MLGMRPRAHPRGTKSRMLRLMSLNVRRSATGASPILAKSHELLVTLLTSTPGRMGVKVADRTTPKLTISSQATNLPVLSARATAGAKRKPRTMDTPTPGKNQVTVLMSRRAGRVHRTVATVEERTSPTENSF